MSKALLSGSVLFFNSGSVRERDVPDSGLELGIPISENGNPMTYALRCDEHVVHKIFSLTCLYEKKVLPLHRN